VNNCYLLPVTALNMEPRTRVSKEPGGSPASLRLLANQG